MANVVVNDTNLTNIADAIREKNGLTDTYKPSEMAAAILAIEAGGGEGIPEEAFSITGDCQYKFAYNGWNWFVEDYGNRVTTKNIINLDHAFSDSNKLTSIPFELNCSATANLDLSYLFQNCSKLEAIPKINNCKPDNLSYMFSGCTSIERFPEDIDTWFDWSYIDSRTTSYGGGEMPRLFEKCSRLRELPINMLKHGNPHIGYTNSMYYNMCSYCYSLDEIVDLPIPYLASWTSNAFSSTFNSCYRLKNFTFAMPDGQPYVVNWKNQIIDFSTYIGTTGGYSIPQGLNGVFTDENKVFSDLSYQALKDSPDWWTATVEYSRYNHDSAVATINSLPDASAYLATAGGTNTIKFRGNLGSATDGGAISNLTAEEIAVASAKGWTVSII